MQAESPAANSRADTNNNGIPDGYEFAHAADFIKEREWRHRGVPMAALLAISTHEFHPSDLAQVSQPVSTDLSVRQKSGIVSTQPSETHLTTCVIELTHDRHEVSNTALATGCAAREVPTA
jgi:hypothetical protein